MKIVFTGPECSGKTTLSRTTAEYLKAGWMPEVARDYLSLRNNLYVYEDLNKIADLHIQEEDKLSDDHENLVLDTDLITLHIWSQEKFGKTDSRITARIQERKYDLYVLCRPDFPWIFDPQRENPDDRDRLFDIYEESLSALKKNYIIVEGEINRRMQKIMQTILFL